MFIIPVSHLITIAAIIDPEGGELLNKLFEEHHKRLCCVAYDVLENYADAEDAVSITFMNVWTHIEIFTGKNNEQIIKLLTVYTQNAAIDIYRNKHTKKNNTVPLVYNDENDEEKDYEIAGDIDLDDILLREERIDQVAKCIDRLPDIDRQILILKYDMEYRSKDIAKIMKMSVTAVDNRVSRAKIKLMNMLEEYING